MGRGGDRLGAVIAAQAPIGERAGGGDDVALVEWAVNVAGLNPKGLALHAVCSFGRAGVIPYGFGGLARPGYMPTIVIVICKVPPQSGAVNRAAHLFSDPSLPLQAAPCRSRRLRAPPRAAVSQANTTGDRSRRSRARSPRSGPFVVGDGWHAAPGSASRRRGRRHSGRAVARAGSPHARRATGPAEQAP